MSRNPLSEAVYLGYKSRLLLYDKMTDSPGQGGMFYSCWYNYTAKFLIVCDFREQSFSVSKQAIVAQRQDLLGHLTAALFLGEILFEALSVFTIPVWQMARQIFTFSISYLRFLSPLYVTVRKSLLIKLITLQVYSSERSLFAGSSLGLFIMHQLLHKRCPIWANILVLKKHLYLT